MIAGSKTHQIGVSLIELMVAITLGLLVVAGVTSIFANSSNARNEIERAGRQTESGQFVMQLLARDLRNAGYYAEFDPRILTVPAAKPDVCTTAVASLAGALPLPVQGYDNGSGIPATCTGTDWSTDPPSVVADVLADVKPNTDILVLRRVSSCIAGVGGCDAVIANAPYFQASLCGNATELGHADSSHYYALDTDLDQLTRHKKDCATLADIRRYRTDIYFVANNDRSGDGIPTLKRAELVASGSTSDFTIYPQAEGIENLQIEYGIDTNSDGAPDVFIANPDLYNGCTTATTPTCAGYWQRVVAVDVHLLARNAEASVGYTDNKTYALGLKADGTSNTVGPFTDRYKRHVYHSRIRLNNPAGRSSTP